VSIRSSGVWGRAWRLGARSAIDTSPAPGLRAARGLPGCAARGTRSWRMRPVHRMTGPAASAPDAVKAVQGASRPPPWLSWSFVG
jgi:hypothetical protein